jgi:hypothetical protein
LQDFNGLNPNAFFHAYSLRNNWLIIPVYSLSNSWPTVFPKYVKKYHYWNNTDRDEDVSVREWNKRGKDWDKVLYDKCCKLTYTFCDCKHFYESPFLDLQNHFIKDKKAPMISVIAQMDVMKMLEKGKDN